MALSLLLAGCSGRLGEIGQPPGFTPIGDPTFSAGPPVRETVANPVPASRSYTIRETPRSPVVMTPENIAMARAAGDMAMQAGGVAMQAGMQAGRYMGRQGASLWSAGPGSLFGDRRARGVGDIVTVLIEIEDEAQITNQTTRSRTGSEAMEATALLGFEGALARILPGENGLNPGIGTSSTSTNAGSGNVRRNEAISLKIAARVVDVLPNGQFVIQGRQEVRVNNELRDLQVLGVIRPEDVSRKNEITYDRIAEARVSYGGRGLIAEAQNPRYGQEAIDVLSPF